MIEPRPITRRRAITIMAGCCAFPATGLAAEFPVAEWRGIALGADARIVFRHGEPHRAEKMLTRVHDEIERLENIFSLYRPDSALTALNRNGLLADAPLELTTLTRRALWYADITGGAFDISIQPLWELYADHFAANRARTDGPSRDDIAATLKKIGPRHIRVRGTSIRLDPGTKLTFNGIAQGYITDRVADMLRQSGWRNVLIQLGETRAIGSHPSGRAWDVGLPGGRNCALVNGALATSSASSTRFGFNPSHHHLFDPASGHSSNVRAAVTVAAPKATDADALSTALFISPPEVHAAILAHVSSASILQDTQPS